MTFARRMYSLFIGYVTKFLHSALWIKVIVLILGIYALFWGGRAILGSVGKGEDSYSTSVVSRGTLTKIINATGVISSGNSTNITTGATGTVKEVFVTNGEQVTKGQKIAELTLDEYGQEQQATAWSNYIDMTNAVKTAQKMKDEYDIAMWEARQAIIDAEDAIKVKDLDPINPSTKKEWTLSERTVVDKNLQKAKLAFSEAESKYKNADAAIQKARARVTAAYRDYQEVSSQITAPIDGVVNNLSLAKGVIIASSTTSKTVTGGNSSSASDTSNTINSQKIGKIYSTDGQLQATVNVSESDVIAIAPSQKAVVTLDAYADKTFTGKVLAVDTSGTVTSGVTSYPVTILLDKTELSLYPNMAVSATIITSVKHDVLLIPSEALNMNGDVYTVDIWKNGKRSSVTVTIGGTDDTQTEIVSGLTVGDVIIIGGLNQSSASENNTTSDFGTNRGNASGSNTNRTIRSIQGGQMGGPPGF